MDLNMGNLIVQLIAVFVTFIPIGGILYNVGRRNQRQDAIETKVADIGNDINNVGKKIDNHKELHYATLNELKEKMETMNNTLGRVTTSIQYIEKYMEKEKGK